MKLLVTPLKKLDPEADLRHRQIARQVNALSEGGITANYNAATAAPTTGTWAAGDFIRNKEPAEAGSVSSKYVVYGWIYSTSGAWLECRFLTGN